MQFPYTCWRSLIYLHFKFFYIKKSFNTFLWTFGSALIYLCVCPAIRSQMGRNVLGREWPWGNGMQLHSQPAPGIWTHRNMGGQKSWPCSFAFGSPSQTEAYHVKKMEGKIPNSFWIQAGTNLWIKPKPTEKVLCAPTKQEAFKNRWKRDSGRSFCLTWPGTRITMERLRCENKRCRAVERTNKN